MKLLAMKSKLAIAILASIMFSLLALTLITYWQFNRVIETELLETMAARTGESARHINTWLSAQLGEVRETANSPVVSRVLELNPQLDLSRQDESIRLIDELNISRWKYVSSAYPGQYAALHIINYLRPGEWQDAGKIDTLMARYYNVKDGVCKTDPWAKTSADEAGERYSRAGQAYDAVFKPAYSQAYGRNIVLMVAWRQDEQGQVTAGAAASLTIETIQQIAQQANYGQKGYEILLAQDGTFVTHPNAEWAMKEKASSVPDNNMNTLSRLVTGASPGVFRFVDGGAKKLAFYNPIPVTGWTLISVVDEDELFAPANKLLILLAGIMAIIILFTLMSVYTVALIRNLKRSHAAREKLVVHNTELNAAKEQLRLQNIALEQAQRHLLDLDRMKDEFLTKVSHELKTPLHGMIGIAECLKDVVSTQPLTESQNHLDLIVTSGARLANLVDEIADFSTLNNNQVHLHINAVSLYDVVQMVITLETFLINDKKITLENRISKDIPSVAADGERLLQVFHNLIRNAVKFTDEGWVAVTAQATDGQVYIAVEDTGIGIEQSRLSTIFNPFGQGDIPKDKPYDGLGLGLSIAKSLLQLHGSTLGVVSKPGEGSRFYFSLPQWEGPADGNTGEWVRAQAVYRQTAAAGPESAPAVMPKEHQQPGWKRILVVDDEAVNRAVVKNCFHGMEYQVVCVGSGNEALAELGRNSYNLVLLDMMMPGLNGIEVCREIRQEYSENSLPIIMLTVRNRTEDIEIAFLAKANDYIVKPFRKRELLARVQAQLSAQEAYETERRAYLAEITALQAQIQPHFLYNTLNTVIAFCRTNSEKAAELLEELSNYLQGKFRFNSMELIPLQQELDLIQSYLAIEQVRFGRRLQVSIALETEENPLIPPLILQPLVENAVKHGVYPKREGGTVALTVQKEQTGTLIIVADDGVGMTSEQVKQVLEGSRAHEVGIGLPNIHKRLLRHYGQGLSIESSLSEGTTIKVRIPCKGERE